MGTFNSVLKSSHVEETKNYYVCITQEVGKDANRTCTKTGLSFKKAQKMANYYSNFDLRLSYYQPSSLKVEICETPNPWYKLWLPLFVGFYYSNDDWQLEWYKREAKYEKEYTKMKKNFIGCAN